MKQVVTNTSQMKCSCGETTCTFQPGVNGKEGVGSIWDTSRECIVWFGTCSSMHNPLVQYAKAANFGVPYPMPCIPVLPEKWDKKEFVLQGEDEEVLTSDATIECAYGGKIRFL